VALAKFLGENVIDGDSDILDYVLALGSMADRVISSSVASPKVAKGSTVPCRCCWHYSAESLVNITIALWFVIWNCR